MLDKSLKGNIIITVSLFYQDLHEYQRGEDRGSIQFEGFSIGVYLYVSGRYTYHGVKGIRGQTETSSDSFATITIFDYESWVCSLATNPALREGMPAPSEVQRNALIQTTYRCKFEDIQRRDRWHRR
jgi:hypothetical protein